VKRIHHKIHDETRQVLTEYLRHLIRDAVVYTDHAHRKTVTASDICYAMKRNGKVLYGFQ